MDDYEGMYRGLRPVVVLSSEIAYDNIEFTSFYEPDE